MSKRKVSVEDKIYAVNLYLDGKESQRRIADMFDVSLKGYHALYPGIPSLTLFYI